MVHAGRSIPSSAFLPIAILMFGLGTQMKVSLAIYAIFWPILLNSMYGVRDTEPLMLATGAEHGLDAYPAADQGSAAVGGPVHRHRTTGG